MLYGACMPYARAHAPATHGGGKGGCARASAWWRTMVHVCAHDGARYRGACAWQRTVAAVRGRAWRPSCVTAIVHHQALSCARKCTTLRHRAPPCACSCATVCHHARVCRRVPPCTRGCAAVRLHARARACARARTACMHRTAASREQALI